MDSPAQEHASEPGISSQNGVVEHKAASNYGFRRKMQISQDFQDAAGGRFAKASVQCVLTISLSAFFSQDVERLQQKDLDFVP